MAKLPTYKKARRGLKTAQKILDNMHADGRGLSRSNIASLVGISMPTVRRFLNGTADGVPPNPSIIAKVLQCYRRNKKFVDWISTNTVNGNIPRSATATNLNSYYKNRNRDGGALSLSDASAILVQVSKKRAYKKRNVSKAMAAHGSTKISKDSLAVSRGFFDLVKGKTKPEIAQDLELIKELMDMNIPK